ncbi:MAG: hypothetical protein J6X81_03605 [Muribaculaceae bacterium]|nr:hypothetical protein [Muribaculaceae bacterium]
MKRLTILLVTAMLAMGMSSCFDNNYPFLGTWELVSIVEGDNEYEIYNSEREQYSFFDDGTGVYTDIYGSEDFYWNEQGGGRIHFRFLGSGLTDDLYYETRAGTLYLSGDVSFYNYRVYKRIY